MEVVGVGVSGASGCDAKCRIFWMVCSFWMEVLEAMVDHMGLAYSMTDLEMALYVLVRVSWDLPQVVEVRAFKTEIDFLAFSAVREICSEKLSLGSKVTPRTLGFLLVGMVMLFMESGILSSSYPIPPPTLSPR